MITAVDSNIFLDVFVDDAVFFDASLAALNDARSAGTLIISEPVFSELSAAQPDPGVLEDFLRQSDVALVASTADALRHAGVAWHTYTRRRSAGTICARCGMKNELHCSRCGESIQHRQHVIADFIIGAHAMMHADQLLTRDRGYYRTYFPDLRLA